MVYWQAYKDLQTERRNPRGMIPVNAITDYAEARALDPDRLKRIMWEVDKTLIEHLEGTDAAKKRQAEVEAEQKRRLGARS